MTIRARRRAGAPRRARPRRRGRRRRSRDRAVGDRLGDRVGLLVDLLEHERLVAALLGGLLVPVDLLDLALDSARRRACMNVDAVRARSTTISPFSMNWTRRVSREEGGDRGGEELLAVAAADDQRALLARADEHVGLVERSSRRTRSGPRARRRRRARPRRGRRRPGGGRSRWAMTSASVSRREDARPRRCRRSLERDVVLDDAVDDDVDAVGACRSAGGRSPR